MGDQKGFISEIAHFGFLRRRSSVQPKMLSQLLRETIRLYLGRKVSALQNVCWIFLILHDEYTNKPCVTVGL